MNLLRFTTAGSVDDGKSTLTGRLLYDTDQIKSDVLKTLSDHEDNDRINLAHVTDGLRAERREGITIDVAYKYFATPRRKFISVDAPGHFRFTRNMITGASGVDAIIILVDALNGITGQTRVHALVASFMRVKNVVVAINKMDLAGFGQDVFDRIRHEFTDMARHLSLEQIQFIPISALNGDNVSRRSGNMPWYQGDTLLHFLETCGTSAENVTAHPVRFIVQYQHPSHSGYAGKLVSGRIKTGDTVLAYPSLQKVRVLEIIEGYNSIEEASAGQNIHLLLEGSPGLKRGDLVSGTDHRPKFDHTLTANICWIDADQALITGKKYLFRMNSLEVSGCISEIRHKIRTSTYETYQDDQPLNVNQFAVARIEAGARIPCDPFSSLRETGRGIIIDPDTNNTSGAFTII